MFKSIFTDFELIIVNDGSTDHVEKVINEFVDKELDILN
jgi:glycosyltransferase involved in cell wall biosynthesis